MDAGCTKQEHSTQQTLNSSKSNKQPTFDLGIEFEASPGCFDRFKHRHGTSYNSVCGDSKVVDENSVRQWKNERLPTLLRGWKAL